MSDISLTTVRHLAEMATQQAVYNVEAIGIGATSRAWRAVCATDKVIVRIIRPENNRPVTYQSEFTILNALRSIGLQVPKPLLCYSDVPASQTTSLPSAWAVTRELLGNALRTAPITADVAKAIARALITIHGLPSTGYGRLIEHTEKICGWQKKQRQGILSRWCWAGLWPFDDKNLYYHP
ncbi:MAG: phosphotransferase, partial [Chloroflexota bacterium]